MGTFENIVSKTRDAARLAGKQASNLVEIARINMDISDAGDKLKTAYSEIGKTLFDKVNAGEWEVADDFSEQIATVHELLKKREELLEKAAELKNEKRCPDCQTINKREGVYCSSCGKEL